MRYLLCALVLTLSTTAGAMTLLEALAAPGHVQNLRLPDSRPTSEAQVPSEVLQVGRTLRPVLDKIRTSRKVYSWDVASPRDRLPNYCIDQCACLARELGLSLKSLGYPVRTMTVRAGRGDFEIRLKMKSGLSPSYNYHQVLVTKIAGRWRVIDPVIIGHTYPERLSVWLERIEGRATKVAEAY